MFACPTSILLLLFVEGDRPPAAAASGPGVGRGYLGARRNNSEDVKLGRLPFKRPSEISNLAELNFISGLTRRDADGGRTGKGGWSGPGRFRNLTAGPLNT